MRSAFEELGGTLRDSWSTFADHDVVAVAEAPDNLRSATISLAVRSGGAVKDYKTTPMFTWEEGVEAMWAPTNVAVVNKDALSRKLG